MVSSFVGCKDDTKDDPTPVSTKPVLNTNFKFEVSNSGEGNDVTFTSMYASGTAVSWLNVSTNATSTDAVYKLNIPKKGDYKFVFSVMVDGAFVAADTFKVTIKNTDVSFLNAGIWKALTGGSTGNKTWVLDLVKVTTTTIDDAGVTTSTDAYKSAFFHNPLDFYNDFKSADVWGPWGGTNLYGWGDLPEVGEISFNGVTGKVKLVLTDGVNPDGHSKLNDKGEYVYANDATAKNGTFESNFTMVTQPNDLSSIILTPKNAGNRDNISMAQFMLEGQYKYLNSLSSEAGLISMSDGVRFPMDKSRIGKQNFIAEDLSNVKIIHASDSALVVRVKRTNDGYDGKTGLLRPDACYLLYNYVVKGYDYGVKTPVTHHVKSIAAADLVGSWKLATVPGNWIGWAEDNILNPLWVDAASMASALTGWGRTNVAEKMTAATKVTLNFTNDGKVTIHNVTFDGTAEVATDYTTTYTVKNGYVAFATDVTITGFSNPDGIVVTGKNFYSVKVTNSADGIWLGQNNGEKPESVAVHLVKAKKK